MSILVDPDTPHPSLVDAAIAAYIRWHEECADTRQAYERWLGAAKSDRRRASYAYAAAIDREEAAAGVYADAMRELEAGCVVAQRPGPRHDSRAA